MRRLKLTIQLALLSGCSAAGSTSHALPNPASVHCEDVGGVLEVLTTQAGEAGFCRLSRALIEEWTLFRGTGQAIETFLAHPDVTTSEAGGVALANPASVYCISVGGTLELAQDSSGGSVGVCKFPDNSAIEEWTLFRGPSDPGSAELLGLLLESNPPAPGGLEPISANDPDVIAAAQFAVDQINARCNCLVHYRLEQIVDAESQVVAGMSYHLTLRLSRGQTEETHRVVVFSQPWLSHMELTSKEVEGRPRRPACSDSDHRDTSGPSVSLRRCGPTRFHGTWRP